MVIHKYFKFVKNVLYNPSFSLPEKYRTKKSFLSLVLMYGFKDLGQFLL